MNEHEEPQPMSRRARRMQEQLETTGIAVVSESAAQASENSAETATAAAPEAIAQSIEISPVDEHGQPRTRREMRELREAALAARAESSAPESIAVEADVHAPERNAGVDAVIEAGVDAEAAIDSSAEVEAEAEADAEADAVAAAVAPSAIDAESQVSAASASDDFVVAEVDTSGFDARVAETEALSFADLIEVATDAVPAEPEQGAPLADAEEAADEAAADVDEAEVAPTKARFRLPWGRSKDAPAPETHDEAVEVESEQGAPEDLNVSEDVHVTEAVVVVSENPDELDADVDFVPTPLEATATDVAAGETAVEAIVEIDGDEHVELATLVPEVEPELESEPEIVVDAAPVEAVSEPVVVVVDDDEDEDEDGEVAGAPAPASARTSYSFPDIAPLAEERSVFDDPTTQTMSALPSDALVAPSVERTGDFDDLISRAIAAEGATSSNTAALILPSMPLGSDLSGPLGETGELYITGSIELPKSLGETGGHARLHDSVESDPMADLGIDLSDEPVPDDSRPVSATRAISARMVEGSGVVAPHSKKGNRLPLVLSVTAGGLLLAVIGLLAWGASNGMFG